MISIAGKNKAQVLAALYNRARPLGLGFRQYDPALMTEADAEVLLKRGFTSFDYLKGRVMKVDLTGDEFNEWAYDRDNDEGAAAEALKDL